MDRALRHWEFNPVPGHTQPVLGIPVLVLSVRRQTVYLSTSTNRHYLPEAYHRLDIPMTFYANMKGFPPSTPDMTKALSPPVHDDSHELPRTNARPMLISPNLRAALEYDEQSRNANVAGSGRLSFEDNVTPTGLPPPPRPKSRTMSLRRIHSPSTSTSSVATDRRTSSPQPSSPPVGSPNPYINPPPQLPHLMVDSPTVMTFSLENRSASGNSPRSSLDSRIGDSPRYETRPSKSPQASSPESAGLPDAKPTFQRHLRYLSSISKVDKLLVMGKALASGKSETRSRDNGRRASNASSIVEVEPVEKLGRDMESVYGKAHRRKLVRSRCSSGDSGSGPSSPVIYSAEMLATRSGELDLSCGDLP